MTAQKNLEAIKGDGVADETVNDKLVLNEVLKMISNVHNIPLKQGAIPENTKLIAERLCVTKDEDGIVRITKED